MTQPASRSRLHAALSAVSVPTVIRAALVLVMLYLFLVGIGLLEEGIAAFGAGFQDAVVAQVSNPVSGLFAGLLATILVQSSSVSTATIVGLVGSGALPLEFAVPMVMGANIGTTVTSTLAALGSVRRKDEFRRAFGAATMHDVFNVLAVAILFPIELLTGVFARSGAALTNVLRSQDVSEVTVDSPIRAAVKAPVGVIGDLLERATTAVAGTVLLVLGLVLILLALQTITRTMRKLVAGTIERAMNRTISRGGGVAGIVIGIAVTIAVQSSSITTSILVPLAAAGILTLRNAFPVTLGANIGTTITALLASLAVVRPEGLTIALVHTLFNLTAVLVVFPVPAIRRFPVQVAERLATVVSRHTSGVAAYVIGLFVVLPLAGVFLL